ncbi:MAG: CBS domain-containing protein [Candidatus Thermoplasmatota archaeon]|nr:CBS domain-containing protein [Candidatus Thermoplasmatota archaeon]
MMKIEDAMSKDLIVGYVPGTIRDALKTLAKHNVSGMPILKKDTKKVAGVLTRSDIFRNPDEEQIALIMSTKPITVMKDDSLTSAAKLLYEHRIHGLPVVDKRKNIVGIISPTDVLKALTDEYDDIVDNYFTRNLVPVYQETPITLIMEIISVTNETALPILNLEGQLAGIVSEGDLFKLSHIKESVSQTNLGMGGDEDEWTWEGIRDTIRLYYSTTKVDLPPVAVKEIMVTNVIKAYKNDPISETARKMMKNKISHVPVVSPENKLLGMVTDIDLMSCMFKSSK